MRTEKERLYIAESFKKYVRLGLLDKRIGEYQRIRILHGFAKSDVEFYDLVSVSDLVKVVSVMGREDELYAFISIYMRDGGRRLCSSKRDIDTAVTRYALRNNCDARTVYRRLSFITSLYIKIRKGYAK